MPATRHYFFGGDKPIFFIGDCFWFDQQNTVNGVTYFYTDGLCAGAKGKDPVKMAMVREGIAHDFVPIFKPDNAAQDPLPIIQHKLEDKGVFSLYHRYA